MDPPNRATRAFHTLHLLSSTNYGSSLSAIPMATRVSVGRWLASMYKASSHLQTRKRLQILALAPFWGQQKEVRIHIETQKSPSHQSNTEKEQS